MASITKRPNGHRWVTFKAPNGKRQTIRLGDASESQAHAFKTRVERLQVAYRLGEPPDVATVEWLATLPDDLHDKLSKCGLAKARGARTIGELVAWFKSSRSSKQSTTVNEEIACRSLVRYFGGDRRINHIDPSEGAGYRAWLERCGAVDETPLALTTASRVCRRARQIFEVAAKQRWILVNPLSELTGWIDTNPERDLYIPTDEVDAVIDHIRDPVMQLLVTFVRYAALRCPSELRPLQWSWIDWKHSTLFVRAVKTERYEGKGTRLVPLAPEITERLEAEWDRVTERGSPFIFAKFREISRGALASRLETSCRRAGVVLWPKPFINLRASCESDWVRTHPIDVVATWTGHSPETMLRHYNRVFKEQSAKDAARALREQMTDAEAHQKAKRQIGSPRTPANSCEPLRTAN